MIDLKATNMKLKQRAKNILRSVAGSECVLSDMELDAVLTECGGSVKLAAVVVTLQVTLPRAQSLLERHRGVLSQVLARKTSQTDHLTESSVVLCVDAGGTSCKAVVRTSNNETGRGRAGACNM